MPVYRQSIFLELTRSIKAFLNLEAGLTRGAAPPEGLLRQLQNRDRTIARLRKELAGQGGAVEPENLVWIFGTARTGSTWLARTMEDLDHYKLWDEPLLGTLFGSFHYGRGFHKKGKNSLLGRSDARRKKLIRSFVLTAARDRFPKATERDYIVVKEPNGSIGAPLLMEALPESRMILLVRDPRDVVASNLSGRGEEGWYRKMRESQNRKGGPPPEDPSSIVRQGAVKYRNFVGRSREAYEAHEGPKTLVKYEDLRSDTPGEMQRIYSDLGLDTGDEELARAVEKHSWESIPEEKKGPGKRTRKATPGGWRKDLTPEQVKVVERITASLLEEFYPDRGPGARL